jgi:hypothetical protein
MKAAPGESPPSSTGRLGDWYASLLVVHSAHLVLCLSERTLLPVIVPAKDIATLPTRLPLAVGEILQAIGVAEAGIT